MEQKIITFSANEQGLIKTGGIDHYASDTISYIKAVFDLGDNWSGYDEVRAVFKTSYVCKNAVLNSVGECIVPFEALMYKGDVRVNLVGSIYAEEEIVDRLTTYSVKALTIDEDVPVCGDTSTPLTPSEYEQFVAKVANDASRAEAGAESAEASASSASASAEYATASAQASEASALRSASSAQTAQASEHNASESAQNASESATSAENAKDDAESARDKILSMRAEAQTLEPNESATASYSNGVLTLGIPKGSDYNLTSADKTEIANTVYGMIESAEGSDY